MTGRVAANTTHYTDPECAQLTHYCPPSSSPRVLFVCSTVASPVWPVCRCIDWCKLSLLLLRFTIAISLVFDWMWSQHIIDNLIVIRSWSRLRQAVSKVRVRVRVRVRIMVIRIRVVQYYMFCILFIPYWYCRITKLLICYASLLTSAVQCSM